VFFDETTRSSTPMPDDFRKILQTGLMPADTEAGQK
jgi:hypothetical protein